MLSVAIAAMWVHFKQLALCSVKECTAASESVTKGVTLRRGVHVVGVEMIQLAVLPAVVSRAAVAVAGPTA